MEGMYSCVKDQSVNIGLKLARGLFLSLRSQCRTGCSEALLRIKGPRALTARSWTMCDFPMIAVSTHARWASETPVPLLRT